MRTRRVGGLVAMVLLLGAVMAAQETAKPAVKSGTHASAKLLNLEQPDKDYMQKIWTGWETINAEAQTKFYDPAPGNVYFDLAPLQYKSWAEYQAGVGKEFKDYSGAKFVVDEAQVHMHGSLAWGTALIHSDMVKKDGKHEKGDFRWTVIWEQRAGKWLIVHEHISAPLP